MTETLQPPELKVFASWASADTGRLGAVHSAHASSPQFWGAAARFNLHFMYRKRDLGIK